MTHAPSPRLDGVPQRVPERLSAALPAPRPQEPQFIPEQAFPSLPLIPISPQIGIAKRALLGIWLTPPANARRDARNSGFLGRASSGMRASPDPALCFWRQSFRKRPEVSWMGNLERDRKPSRHANSFIPTESPAICPLVGAVPRGEDKGGKIRGEREASPAPAPTVVVVGGVGGGGKRAPGMRAVRATGGGLRKGLRRRSANPGF